MSDVVRKITNADKLVVAAEELRSAAASANMARIAHERAHARLEKARKAYDEADREVRDEANRVLDERHDDVAAEAP